MIGNVRIPAALSLVVGAGLAVSLAIAAAGGGCAYAAAKFAELAFLEASRMHDANVLALLAAPRRLQQLATVALVVLSTSSALLALLSRHWLTRKVVDPLDGAMRVVNAIAFGELREPIVVDARTQARRLFVALAQMRQSLMKTISLVTHEAVAIDARAAKLARENQRLATGAKTQAAAIEETAATTEQISEGAERIAQLAAHTNRLADNASTLAASSSARVQALIAAIASITQHSQQVSEMISVVNDLAFQTNILALNAAVEAARAGHQGKGFAVVASEVRTLAQRSASAAREIDESITRAQATIERGAALCADAEKAMDGVVSAAREVLELSDDMRSSAGEQSRSVQQLNGALKEIDYVTQQNTQMVQRFVEATEDLGSRANALADAVGAWKLD